MLENKSLLSSVSEADVFAGMLRDMPWNNLRDYLQANAQVMKRCTAGGHRLEKKHRDRFEKIIVKEAEKAEFSQSFCGAAFAHWYPVHEQLHGQLEGYFHSDEYKAYREGKGLEEDKYVLPEDKFTEFFAAKDIPKWRILLCFSPLEFTDEQAEKILHDAAGNEDLILQMQELRKQLAQLNTEKTLAANENQDLRNRLEQLTREGQEGRQERKELRAARDTLQTRLDTLQNEARKARDELAQKEQSLAATKESAAKSTNQEILRLQRDLARLSEEVEDWKGKYEKQRIDARELQENLRAAEKALAEERNAHQSSRKEIKKAETFVDIVLDRLDWVDVGRQLHLTPQLKQKFNSLIKRLNYDADRNLTLGTSLASFWTALQGEESELLAAISESDTREVENGEVEQYWLSLTDTFEDVHIGLEARALLLRMLQEIFYQTIEMKDLEESTVPGAKSRKK
jgi:hypothetical protein